MSQAQKNKSDELLNGFIAVDLVENRIDELIVPPGLGADSGVLGAIAMAGEKAEKPGPDWSD